MNSTKVTRRNESDNNKFVNTLSKVMPSTPRQNGTPAGVSALAESLNRGNSYLQAQQRLNDVCLPEAASQLSNTFIAKETSHA